MDITSKKNKIIDIKALTGRLKMLKNEAAVKRREKEKAKYEEKKRREKQRYHAKRQAKLAIQKVHDMSLPSPVCSSSLPEAEIEPASDNSLLSKGFKTTKKIAEVQSRPKKKKTISTEEKRRKEREKKRRQRQKLKEDKAKHEEYCRKERDIYQKKKRLGKITLISEKNKRDQRIQRKQWRMRQQNRRMKLKTVENFLINNSPPESRPVTPENAAAPENQRPSTPGVLDLSGNIVINQIYKLNKSDQTKTPKLNTSTKNEELFKKLKRTEMRLRRTQQKLNIQKTKAERYKKQLQRKHRKVIRKSSTALTPNTKVDVIVQRGDTKEIKKQLLFCEVLQEQIKLNVDSCSTEVEKQVASKIISGRVAKRYRVAGKMNGLISNHRSNKSLIQEKIMPSKRLRMEEHAQKIRKLIFDFFISDEVSVQTPGKKDCITVRQQKMQKRYLNDTLTNLYKKFMVNTHQKVSFSIFCRYKPFWVITPTVSARNTCLCVKHANFMFLFKKMQQLNQFFPKITSLDDILEKICCASKSDRCLVRQCDNCAEKENEIIVPEDNGKRTISYFKWEPKTEKRIDKNRKEVEVKIQTKVSIESTIENLRISFKSNLKIIMPHHYRANHQQNQIRLLRDQITEKEAIINIDFSENYMCKFNEEIQSVHFGGSRRQISLHTGVAYLKNKNKELECISFCGVSNDLLHNACAVWAHLKPILTLLSERNISIFHFVSDGPTSQYKNKTNFQLMCYFAAFFKIDFLTWNFYEPGHGKSVADGVGGALKRVADQTISHGNSITSANNFIESIRQNNSKIILYEVTTSQINEIIELSKKIIPENASSVPNTMKIRQVIWSHEKNTKLKLKHRSCFNCSTKSTCDHFLLKPSEHLFDKLLLNDFYTSLDRKRSIETHSSGNVIFDIATVHTNNIEPNDEREEDLFMPHSHNEITSKYVNVATHKTNMDSSDDEEDNIPLSHLYKTSKNCNQVIKVNKAEIKKGDWLLIRFELEAKQGGKPLKYICQVIETKNKFEGTFLRQRSTRDFQGFVYGFPDIVDIYEFSYEDIMGKVEAPTNHGRGLLRFKINTNVE